MYRASFFIILILLGNILLFSGTAAGQSGTLTVESYGFDSDRGKAMIGLYDSPKGFLRTVKPGFGQSVPIRGGRARAVFSNLPYGWYGVGIIHDENDNGTMDTILGIPKEDYGISNNVRGTIGQPTFDQAKFKIDGPEKQISIEVK